MKIANLRNEVQNSNGNWNGNDRVEFSSSTRTSDCLSLCTLAL